MKQRNFLLVILLLSGLVILSACAPETPAEESQEPPYPYPVPEVRFEESEPYPYPEPQKIIIPNPYPGIEVDGDISDLNMAEALPSVELVVLDTDNELQTGPVFIDRSEIIMKESYPVQVELVLVGNLPTPCNKLRVVPSEPDENGHIEVEAYTVSNPDKMCAQVLEPFIAVIPLGDFTDGVYTISINNEMKGQFQLP